MEEAKTIEDLNPIMCEYPFVYKVMTIDSYEEEKAYYGKHLKEYFKGEYLPLWKQRGETHKKYDGSHNWFSKKY